MMAFHQKTQPQQQTQQLPADQDVGLMLCQCLRRWASIKKTSRVEWECNRFVDSRTKAGRVSTSNYLHYLDDMYA